MPFGLAIAPSTFQCAINVFLIPVLGKHTLAYLNDVIIYSTSFEEHLSHKVLGLLAQAGFRLNVSVCQLAINSFMLLGFLIPSQGISPDPEKVEAISRMQPMQMKGKSVSCWVPPSSSESTLIIMLCWQPH